MVYDYGYGMLTDHVEMKQDKLVELIEKFGDEDLQKEFHEFVEDSVRNDGITKKEAQRDYFEDYNEWEFIADLLNLRHPNMMFRAADCCLYVGAYFPMDKEAKKEMPTTGEIGDAIHEMVNPDTAVFNGEGAGDIDYYTIDDD